MEPDRFDEGTSYRIIESPEPAPRRWRKRWTVIAAASVLAAGGLTAGASALAGSDDAGGTSAAKPTAPTGMTADGVPTGRDGHRCRDKAGKDGMRRDHRQSRSVDAPAFNY
jgi:hypothetical protein